MSIELKSVDDVVSDGICNGDWSALIAMAQNFGEDVPSWNGCHDGQVYTPEQLRAINRRLKQLSRLSDLLDELAEHGGCKIT